jgi:hypothetical protein
MQRSLLGIASELRTIRPEPPLSSINMAVTRHAGRNIFTCQSLICKVQYTSAINRG